MTDSADPRLAAALAELAQLRRWFDLMDGQMQVLDRERQKLAALVNQSDTPMFSVDGEQVVRWTNAALRAVLERSGRGEERVVGHPVGALWESLGADHSPSCVSRALGDGHAVRDELWLRRDGGARVLYVTAMPIKDKEGQTAEVLAMVQDLSDLDVLRRSEARYRLLFEQSPDAMIIATLEDGAILLANQAAGALTGHGVEELASLSLEQLHEPGAWPSARQVYARMAAGELDGPAELELRARRGQNVVAKVTASRFDLDDLPVTLLVMQDVTMQRKLEAELRHSQKMEVVGRLAAGVTHEFNNIMTVILAGAEMLKTRAGEDSSLCEIADTTEKAAHRAALLTRKLLGFSRKEQAKRAVLDLNEVLRGIEGLLVILLGERADLHLELTEVPCLVRGDRTQLEEVVFNLAANARDAMPQGGNLWIRVSRREGGDVLLLARDDGEGMDERTRERLFEPFFTTKAPHEGTGLGMSTILDIVQGHGGVIEVESAPGAGASFEVTLPGARPSAAVEPVAPRLQEGARGEERILVVDDRGEVRRAAARLLGLDGYRVQIAASAQETLALLGQRSFDLLITDVVMPGMSGVELAAIVERRFPGTRILFMSAYTDREVLPLSADGADFIRKPFTRSTLSLKVREMLDRPRR